MNEAWPLKATFGLVHRPHQHPTALPPTHHPATPPPHHPTTLPPQYVRTGGFSISARTDRSELDFGQSLERRQDSETARRRAKLAQQHTTTGTLGSWTIMSGREAEEATGGIVKSSSAIGRRQLQIVSEARSEQVCEAVRELGACWIRDPS